MSHPSPVRLVKGESTSEKTVGEIQKCAIISPNVAEEIRRIVREEMGAIQKNRRRALLAEVDSINRELGLTNK